MKKLLTILTLAASRLVASAQTNLPPQTTFFQTTLGYFSSFNPNLHTFDSNKFEVLAGMDYVNNLNTASSLGIEWNFGTFAFDSVTKNAGIAGVVLSQQLGVAVSRVIHDAKLSLFLDAGYDFERNKGFIEPRVEAKKALTDNTFAGVSIGSKFFLEKPKAGAGITPTFSIFAGFVF